MACPVPHPISNTRLPAPMPAEREEVVEERIGVARAGAVVELGVFVEDRSQVVGHGPSLTGSGYPHSTIIGEQPMKALVCPELGGEEVLRIEELEPRDCGPKDVRIAVRAASVNFPDTLVIRGEYQYKYDPPFVPGHESSGTVTEVGADGRRPRGRRSGAGDDGDRRVRERGRRHAAPQRPGVPHPRRHGLGRSRRVRPHLRHRHPGLVAARPARRRGRACSCSAPPAAPARPRSRSPRRWART